MEYLPCRLSLCPRAFRTGPQARFRNRSSWTSQLEDLRIAGWIRGAAKVFGSYTHDLSISTERWIQSSHLHDVFLCAGKAGNFTRDVSDELERNTEFVVTASSLLRTLSYLPGIGVAFLHSMKCGQLRRFVIKHESLQA